MASFDPCSSLVVPFLDKSGGGYACWSSLLSLLPSETIGYTRSECSTNPNARLAFRGDSGVILLSKYPIGATVESLVLPGAESRISVIRAPIQLPSGSDLDVYCTQFTLPGEGFSRPYGGRYGNGKTGDAAWQEELKLQANKLISFVNKRSRATGTRAIVSGTFYTGPDSPGSSDIPVMAFHVEAYNLLTAALGIAVPFDYVPTCTECFNNPLVKTPTQSGRWTSYSLLANIARTSVRQAQVILTEPVLEVQSELDSGAPYSIPISPYYGMRSVVAIFPIISFRSVVLHFRPQFTPHRPVIFLRFRAKEPHLDESIRKLASFSRPRP